MLRSLMCAVCVLITLESASRSARAHDAELVEAFRQSFEDTRLSVTFVSAEVPVVACPMDGQVGPMDPPPLPSTARVLVPQAAASRVALYSMDKKLPSGVLAPRGWVCHGLYGSSGNVLLVQPSDIRGDPRDAFYNGPFVSRSFSEGDTSGRFAIVSIAPRLFPSALAFAREVQENFPETGFSVKPWPYDRVVQLAEGVARFTTPGGNEGLGMLGQGPYAPVPVHGVVVFASPPDRAPYLVNLRVRPDVSNPDLYIATAMNFLDNVRPAAPETGTDEAPATRALATVQTFYAALSRADGEAASEMVIPDRRRSGPYAPKAISRFYGSLPEPLRLASATPRANGDVEVVYRYRKPGGAVCNGRAVASTEDVDGRTLINRIRPAGNC